MNMKHFTYYALISTFVLVTFSCDTKGPADYTMYVHIDDWTHKYEPGTEKEFPVVITNKMEDKYDGQVVLRIMRGDSVVSEVQQEVVIAKLEKSTAPLSITFPQAEGTYEVVAEIVAPDGHTVKSRRVVEVDKPIVLDSLDLSEL